MLDLVVLRLRKHHKPFGTKQLRQKEGDTARVSGFFSKGVRMYDGGMMVTVTSLENGLYIEIRCCPLKVLQGHNVFGTDNVRKLCYHLICYVLERLRIAYSNAERMAWAAGDYDVRALDITHHFRVESRAMIGTVLGHLFRNTSYAYRPAALERGIGVRLIEPEGRARWLLYDKLKEFDDKRTKQQAYVRALVGDADTEQVMQHLRRSAARSIRVELKLDDRYLAKSGLGRGASWDRKKVRQVYLRELQKLRLDQVPALAGAQAVLSRLPDPKLQMTFVAWLHRLDLTQLHGPDTLRARRRAILAATGLDIKLDQVPLSLADEPVADIFRKENMLPDFPGWVDHYPCLAYRGQGLGSLVPPPWPGF